MTILIILFVMALVGIFWVGMHILAIPLTIIMVLWELRVWIISFILLFYGICSFMGIIKGYKEHIKPLKSHKSYK